MVIHNVQQNSTQWRELRAGVPTASGFKNIYTPGGKASGSFDRYLHELLAERIMHQPIDGYASKAMVNGHATEDEAIKFYEMQRLCDTERVGFVTTTPGR